MEKNKIVKTIFALLLFSSVTSCKKYLDKKPNNTLTIPESIVDLQALLDDATVMNNTLTPSYGQLSTDDYFLLENTYSGREQTSQDAYRWVPTVYNWQNDWSKAYNAIYNANYCLEMIEEIPITTQNEAAWKNIKGSSLFHRAFNFLNLIWNHGKAYDESSSGSDLGIVLRLSSDFNEKSVRASVKESYDQIIRDAKECISYLPDLPNHPYRPSKAAAYGLLARAYLSMRKYDDALTYANLSLQIKNVLINCKQPSTDPDFLGTTTSFPFKQFNKETIFYAEMNLVPFTMLSTSRAKIDTQLYQSYAANDLRKASYFTPASGYYSFKGSYCQGNTYFTGIATDEMYLTRAECYARKGDKTAALDDLNAVLIKRYDNSFVPAGASDAADALNKILIERRKELYFRGLRWPDIKRLNKEGANIILTRKIGTQTYTLQPNANYYALPLPTDVINITGMPQNPG